MTNVVSAYRVLMQLSRGKRLLLPAAIAMASSVLCLLIAIFERAGLVLPGLACVDRWVLVTIFYVGLLFFIFLHLGICGNRRMSEQEPENGTEPENGIAPNNLREENANAMNR